MPNGGLLERSQHSHKINLDAIKDKIECLGQKKRMVDFSFNLELILAVNQFMTKH